MKEGAINNYRNVTEDLKSEHTLVSETKSDVDDKLTPKKETIIYKIIEKKVL